MKYWDEIRTAAQVARSGTISAAATVLGVHRATVNRHIDVLERDLGSKLFIRHGRGFTPTELGLDVLRVADATDDQFDQLRRRASRQASTLSGELVITAIDLLIPDLLAALSRFSEQHPDVYTRVISSPKLLRLEYSEAHIALRAGRKPEDPDNVVQAFKEQPMGLFATTKYIEQFGKPETEQDYPKHRFVGPDSMNQRAPFLAWMTANIPDESMVFRSDQAPVLMHAVQAGLGIGFLPLWLARSQNDLVEVLPARDEWKITSWIVTHVDMHRTPKVQAFLETLKSTNANEESDPASSFTAVGATNRLNKAA